MAQRFVREPLLSDCGAQPESSMALSSDPRPPASQTATQSSLPGEPVIDA